MLELLHFLHFPIGFFWQDFERKSKALKESCIELKRDIKQRKRDIKTTKEDLEKKIVDVKISQKELEMKGENEASLKVRVVQTAIWTS